MKVVTIIFCILTIIMLVALAISIVKNEEKATTNKEKRYMLLYLTSFIILMISSISSTLGNNVLSIILFIIFILLIFLATFTYFKFKKGLSRKNKKPLLPKKLKNNLKVIKEENDTYTYTVKTNLTCCDESNFKVESIKDKDLTIIHCTCNKCKTEYEVYNSELDGYKLKEDNSVKIIKKEFKQKKCSKCKKDNYKVEIVYEYLNYIQDNKPVIMTDPSNMYSNIKINLNCLECNKKEKGFIDHDSN